MEHMIWNEWYSGWGWFLWFGVWFLFLLSFGNWGYSYRAHQKYDRIPLRTPMDTLNERYASGEIQQEDYIRMKKEIS